MMDPAASPDQVTLSVQWGDLDALGHVNNVVFFRWTESGRISFMERRGLMSGDWVGSVGPIVAAASLNFRRQVNYPSRIVVSTRCVKTGTSSFTLEHLLTLADSAEVVADGASGLVLYDYAARRPVPLPIALRQALIDTPMP
jgi:acyl-CoA thioester hydrolase